MIKNKLLIISLVPFTVCACASIDSPQTSPVAGITSTTSTSSTDPALALDSSFTDCSEVYNAGWAELPRDHPLYTDALDFDHDGIACEIEIEEVKPLAKTVATDASPTPKY